MEATSFDNPVVPEDFTVIVVDEDAGLGEFLAGELERVVGTFTDVNDLQAPPVIRSAFEMLRHRQ